MRTTNNNLQNGSGSATYDSDSESPSKDKKRCFSNFSRTLTSVTDGDDENVQENCGRHKISNVDIGIEEMGDDAIERDAQLGFDDGAPDSVPT